MSVELYDSQHPQAAKWLLPDGTVTYQLPIMGSVNSAGGGGTDDHAELLNLDYAHSGHTGFASQADTNDLASRVLALEEAPPPAVEDQRPIIQPFKEIQFLPGLSLNRARYGDVWHYWINGEYDGTTQQIPHGAHIVTAQQCPEIEEYIFDVHYVVAGVGRAKLNPSLATQFHTVIFQIDYTGIKVAAFSPEPLNLAPPDNKYQGTQIAFWHTLFLGELQD